jgi:hypothetical protein
VCIIDINYKTLVRDNQIMMKAGKQLVATGTDETENYEKQYKRIAKKLDSVIDTKNPGHHWEAYVENFGWQKKTGIMDRFEATNGQYLLEQILPATENKFSIFEFKKTGFAINNRHSMNEDGDEWYYVLPACMDGFHRDWKHDGICIQTDKKE